MPQSERSYRPRRAVLFMPASNEKAIAKLSSLACDAVIFDLEDSVAPGAKAAARERLKAWFATRPKDGPECLIRVNPLASEWGPDDVAAVCACAPDAVLLPKVNTPRDIHDFDDALDEGVAPDDLRLWIMVETPKAMLNIGALAEFGRDRAARLDCFVAGTNDLIKDTGVLATPDRRYIMPWLLQMVLAARAGEKAFSAGSICAGWISVLPSKPMAAPSAHSLAKASRSRKLLLTPSRISRPPARAASTICSSQGMM